MKALLNLLFLATTMGCDSGNTAPSAPVAGGGNSPTTTTPNQVPEGWTKWAAPTGNDHFYKILESATDWTTAKSNAEAVHGHLVTITTAAEQEFIKSNFLTGNNQLKVFWIGCSDAQTEDTFVWVTGEPFSYTNWKSGEPNGWDGEGEDYCCINWNAVRGPIGEWNDALLGGSKGYDSGKNDGPYAAIIEADTVP